MGVNTYNYLKKHDEFMLSRFADLASVDSLFKLPRHTRHHFRKLREEIEDILASEAPDKYDEDFFEALGAELEILESDYELIALRGVISRK